jgi:hypothetical protein
MLLCGPSSGFVVPGGHREVILIDFSPAFKNKFKINFVM